VDLKRAVQMDCPLSMHRMDGSEKILSKALALFSGKSRMFCKELFVWTANYPLNRICGAE